MRKLVYLIMAMLPVLAVSCTGNVDPDATGGTSGESGLTITVDKDIIQTGVDKAAVTVRYKGEVIEDGVIFYLGDPTDIKTVKNAEEYMEGHSFSTSEAGAYSLFALYNTYKSSAVTITAIPVAVPATPDDPQPQSTDFRKRLLLAQFTGTACGYCPGMMAVLHPVLENETGIADDIVWVASHSYDYVSSQPDKAWIENDFGNKVGASFPSLNFNLATMYTNSLTHTSESLTREIKKAYEAMGVPAGIALNLNTVGDQIILKVTVKAGAETDYRVGAFLLEDGIEADQISASETWMNTHDACIRWIDATDSYVGHKLGRLAAGELKSKVFIWDLKDVVSQSYRAEHYWDPIVKNNLRVAVFVTAPAAVGNYAVVNALATTSNSQIIPFEYNAD